MAALETAVTCLLRDYEPRQNRRIPNRGIEMNRQLLHCLGLSTFRHVKRQARHSKRMPSRRRSITGAHAEQYLFR